MGNYASTGIVTAGGRYGRCSPWYFSPWLQCSKMYECLL